MKKIPLIAISTIIVILIVRFSGRHLYKWISEQNYTYNSELPNSKIYLHNDLSLNFYELNSIKNLVEKTIIQVDSILPNNLPKVKVFISTGNNSATTIPEFNKITLFNSTDCYAPFCHEYIHTVLGVHKELWFSEGVATYLGQEIRSKNEILKKYCDGDERYLINARELTSGPLTKNEYFATNYTYDSIKELVLNTKRFSELTVNNKLDYYFLSASFCKYMFESIGEEEMIKTLLEIKESHNSIQKNFEKRKIDLDMMINSWLMEYKD
jgi:hypothetical protein